jgi:hypothetical protein
MASEEHPDIGKLKELSNSFDYHYGKAGRFNSFKVNQQRIMKKKILIKRMKSELLFIV